MILVFHSENRIIEITTANDSNIKFDISDSIALGIQKIAQQFPDEKIVWCKSEFKKYLNSEIINSVFIHNKMMLSFNPGNNDFINKKIGYVDENLFVNINKNNRYPTWKMSSAVGVISAAALLEINNKIKYDIDFDYYLNSIAKIGMPLGLICYSEPKLFKQNINVIEFNSSFYTLFKFVKQHYKFEWLFLLFFNFIIFERKLMVFPLINSLFYKKIETQNISFESIKIDFPSFNIENETVDVIIPTIGRKDFLLNFLLDLKQQSHIPKTVIIVEQNPNKDSETELDYLTNQDWPFIIKHTFTHQSGVCNARNIALKQIESKWVFFADDDIRIEYDFIEKSLYKTNEMQVKSVYINCFEKGKKQVYNTIFQTPVFGSGCSFVYSEIAKKCEFLMSYEFGFGEDLDFGIQIRKLDCDVLFLPEPKILHLKAPIGGFRIKPVFKWSDEIIQPKPSPTVMLYFMTHYSKEQLLGYKTTLFFKYYKHQKRKNPINYFFYFRKQWNRSLYWANELKTSK